MSGIQSLVLKKILYFIAAYYAGLSALKHLSFIYPGLHPGLGYVSLSGRR